jgi:hypothetical protein
MSKNQMPGARLEAHRRLYNGRAVNKHIGGRVTLGMGPKIGGGMISPAIFWGVDLLYLNTSVTNISPTIIRRIMVLFIDINQFSTMYIYSLFVEVDQKIKIEFVF